MRTFVRIFVWTIHLLLADALAKHFAVSRIGNPPRSIEVVPGFFNLSYVENFGCAWGMFQGYVWPLALFGMAVFFLVLWKRREIFSLDAPGWRSKAGAAAETLLYAGMAGNLIDRVFRGCVIDFLDFHAGNAYHFPCFNLADIYITVAAAIIVLQVSADRSSREKK